MCDESDIFCAVGGKCLFYGGRKVRYFGRWYESVYFVVVGN